MAMSVMHSKLVATRPSDWNSHVDLLFGALKFALRVGLRVCCRTTHNQVIGFSLQHLSLPNRLTSSQVDSGLCNTASCPGMAGRVETLNHLLCIYHENPIVVLRGLRLALGRQSLGQFLVWLPKIPAILPRGLRPCSQSPPWFREKLKGDPVNLSFDSQTPGESLPALAYCRNYLPKLVLSLKASHTYPRV